MRGIKFETEYVQQISADMPKKRGIRFRDLLNGLIHEYLVACDARWYQAFRDLDMDDDGRISTEDLKQIMKGNDPLGEFVRANEIIQELSLDEDGDIDYEDFLWNLHPNFENTPGWIPSVFQRMKSMTRWIDESRKVEDSDGGSYTADNSRCRCRCRCGKRKGKRKSKKYGCHCDSGK